MKWPFQYPRSHQLQVQFFSSGQVKFRAVALMPYKGTKKVLWINGSSFCFKKYAERMVLSTGSCLYC